MTPPECRLDGRSLTVAEVVRAARDPRAAVTADRSALAALAASRDIVEGVLASGATIYGINTGFGKLANIRVAPGALDELQVNLVRSHAAGVGDPLPREIVRALMLLRANVLLRPTSGVRPALVEALLAMLNAGIVPRVPEQGSVGASGDLAPLSHVALALMARAKWWPAATHFRRRRRLRPRGWHRSASPRRKESPSSTARRRRPRSWRCWCMTRKCSGVPASRRRP
jgi:histidine ammonia-lyase